MKLLQILVVTALMAVCMVGSSEAGWLIYHKPEFSGKIIDAETRQPIEGAVVVAVYNKKTMGLGAGSYTSIINVREALTDKDGLFRIASYTTLIQPFSWEYATTFTIFKPGYASISGINMEQTFSIDMDIKEVEYPWIENKNLKFLSSSRLVGLPKLKTREERKLSRMSADISGADIDAKDLPSLYKIISEERKNGF